MDSHRYCDLAFASSRLSPTPVPDGIRSTFYPPHHHFREVYSQCVVLELGR